MTTVHVSMARDDGTGTLAAMAGSLYWEPTTRREDGTVVVLPVGFAMNLTAGEATKEVEPSGLTWCWRVTERVEDGTVRYVAVPDSAETVEYVDLPDVDPDTLVAWSPADPEAAYQNALDNLDVEAAVETYLLANPVTAPVDSVNGETGVVVLDAADVGAVAPADLATVATTGAYGDLSGTPTLGDAAAKNTGTTAGTVAAGDDSRITGAAQKAANLSDLADAPTARTNLGLGTAATAETTDFAPIAQPRNTQTGTAYTLVASDAGKIVTLDNAAAITVTVPASTITVPADTVVRVDFLVLGAGMPTFVGSGGMTINADPSLVADAQYAGMSLLLLSATSGVLVGRLATP